MFERSILFAYSGDYGLPLRMLVGGSLVTGGLADVWHRNAPVLRPLRLGPRLGGALGVVERSVIRGYFSLDRCEYGRIRELIGQRTIKYYRYYRFRGHARVLLDV